MEGFLYLEWGRENGACVCVRIFFCVGGGFVLYGDMVAYVFCVKMGYFKFLILWYNVEHYASMRC
jgi:hypothetical protein